MNTFIFRHYKNSVRKLASRRSTFTLFEKEVLFKAKQNKQASSGPARAWKKKKDNRSSSESFRAVKNIDFRLKQCPFMS